MVSFTKRREVETNKNIRKPSRSWKFYNKNQQKRWEKPHHCCLRRCRAGDRRVPGAGWAGSPAGGAGAAAADATGSGSRAEGTPGSPSVACFVWNPDFWFWNGMITGRFQKILPMIFGPWNGGSARKCRLPGAAGAWGACDRHAVHGNPGVHYGQRSDAWMIPGVAQKSAEKI